MGFIGDFFSSLKTPNQPPMPDFSGAAAQQGALNSASNNPNIYGPYGTQTSTQNATVPGQWDVHQTLSPTGQQLFDNQNNIALQLGDISGDALGRVGKMMDSGFSMRGAPGRTTGFQPGQLQWDVGAPSGQTRDRVEDAYYDRSTSRLDPQFQERDASLRSDLVARGLSEGTEAWDNAYGSFERGRNDAYSGARNDAIIQGGNEMARDFGIDLARGTFHNAAQGQDFGQNMSLANLTNSQRQAWMQEQAYLRQLPLQELNALRTGSQPTMPQFQNFQGGSYNMSDAAKAAGSWQSNMYNQDVGMHNNAWGGIFDIASSFMPGRNKGG